MTALVKLVKLENEKECNACGKKITIEDATVRMIDEEDNYVQYYHFTEKCCDETFEDYLKITEQETRMDEV